MTVYLVIEDMGYDGKSVLGVAEDEPSAIEMMHQQNRLRNPQDGELRFFAKKKYWACKRDAMWTYLIEPFEVYRKP